jgi:multidrug resistance protein, MATE family
MYATLGGFYLIALPVAVILCFIVRLVLSGLLMGVILGALTSLVVLILFVVALDWDAGCRSEEGEELV